MELLLAGFIPEMHLKQPGFTQGASTEFTKNKIKKEFKYKKKKGDTKYIYRNVLDKACFQHEKAYGDFNDSERRTVPDKVLNEKIVIFKILNISQTPKYDRYQRGLASWFISFLIKNPFHLQINLPKVMLKMKLNKMSK